MWELEEAERSYAAEGLFFLQSRLFDQLEFQPWVPAESQLNLSELRLHSPQAVNL